MGYHLDQAVSDMEDLEVCQSLQRHLGIHAESVPCL